MQLLSQTKFYRVALPFRGLERVRRENVSLVSESHFRGEAGLLQVRDAGEVDHGRRSAHQWSML